jgi:hypothetical protein
MIVSPTRTSGAPEVRVGLTDSLICNECKKSHGMNNIQYSNKKLHEDPSNESRVVPCGLTDGQTYMTS